MYLQGDIVFLAMSKNSGVTKLIYAAFVLRINSWGNLKCSGVCFDAYGNLETLRGVSFLD
jgi:hypothetical protein